MNTKWLGLWEQEAKGLYAGQTVKKADIPKHTRILLKNNKYYKKGTKRPKFVYCFADSEGYEEMCAPLDVDERPYKEDGVYYTENGERLYTRDDAREIINGTMRDAQSGISDPYDILPEDFV